MSYIKCDNLTLGYDGVPVMSDLSFEVSKGDYLCIIGENGAGKSTLVKTILSLIKPMSGTIEFSDGLKPYEIGYLPQQTIVQKDFPASVLEIVLSGTLASCKHRPFYSKKEKKLARENMEKLSVWELRDESYRNLSGGQQQRVLLARALCSATKVILLDEPVTGLDPKVTNEFYQLIKKLNDEQITIIMISHDIHATSKYATHILHIGKGKYFVGTKEKYLESDEWKQFGYDGGDENE